MSLDAFACLFASAPIRDCGRAATEPVLASSWPMAAMGLAIITLTGWAFLRTIFPHRINWNRDRAPDWDVGADERSTIEIRARRAGE